jgi:siderophore synthetase component
MDRNVVATVAASAAPAEPDAEHVARARAAVLARLWGALAREPIVGVAGRRPSGADLLVEFDDGRTVHGPVAAAAPFAVAPAGFALQVSGAMAIEYDDPAALLRALALPGADVLAPELDNSVANLALAYAAQPLPGGGPATLLRLAAGEEPDPVAHVEQLVVEGHPLHPCCRTRMGMSEAEVRAYAPEHRPVVALELFGVPADAWLSTGSGVPPLLPLHPWQAARVRSQFTALTPTGRRVLARPLMSLRTLAPMGDRAIHLKTAVDVQMTSAVRTVSAAAVRNGPAVSALLAGLARHTSGLRVLRERAAGAVLVDGQPSRSLAYVRRDAPLVDAGEVALPLAALAAPSPTDGRPLVREALAWGYQGRPLPFLADLVALLVPPMLRLLHDGAALEAHGQNTLVVLRDGRPVRVLYRDVGGVRLSPARLRRAGVEPPALHGDLGTDDPDALRTKLFAALVSTVLGEVVAVLARECGLDPDRAWATAADTIRDRADALPDDNTGRSDLAALFADTLPVKATTAMRLAADPLHDTWAPLANPLAARR